MDNERRKEIIKRWSKVDRSKIRVVTSPDEPLETFLSAVFGVKRMLVINTDAKGKEHVLRVLKKFANDQGWNSEFLMQKGQMLKISEEIIINVRSLPTGLKTRG
ncbi:hypothetical protein [Moorella sp. E306M]|uniref:hypothetical protein n=1 Tax=Moorella sp. E306M TaxID=2572683 RepID=UPI0010FFC04D|nr:hypothetical protein [Moorella sp. E306M]GEA18935.1 hypothetical protein E306M_20720 [Moorella sp. E306M]